MNTAATLLLGHRVVPGTVPGYRPIWIGRSLAAAAGLCSLQLSHAFTHRPGIASCLQNPIFQGALHLVGVKILVAIFHGFDKFAVSGELVATELKKLGASTGLSLGAVDVTADRRAVDLVHGVGVAGPISDVNTVLVRRFVTLPLNCRFHLCQSDTRQRTHCEQNSTELSHSCLLFQFCHSALDRNERLPTGEGARGVNTIFRSLASATLLHTGLRSTMWPIFLVISFWFSKPPILADHHAPRHSSFRNPQDLRLYRGSRRGVVRGLRRRNLWFNRAQRRGKNY